MKIIVAVIVLISVITSTQARFLDSVELCDERYGKPVEIIDKGEYTIRIYHVDDITISAYFYKNVAERILFHSTKKDFTDSDASEILKRNEQTYAPNSTHYLRLSSPLFQTQSFILKHENGCDYLYHDGGCIAVYSGTDLLITTEFMIEMTKVVPESIKKL